MHFRNFAVLSSLALVLSVLAISVSVPAGLAQADEPSVQQLQNDLNHTQAQVVQTITRIVPLPGQTAVPAQLVQPGQPGQPAQALTPAGVTLPAAGDGIQPPVQLPQLPPELAQKLEFAKGLLQNKWVQKYMRVMMDPQVQKTVTPLVNSPMRMDWVFAELGWLVFIMVVKAWRMTKVKGVAGILGLQFLSLGVMVAGVLYFIPMFLFGNDYSAFVDALMAAAGK